MLPEPVITECGRFQVLRDDLLPGGTKRRALPAILTGADYFVYATPACGFAQVALAYACRDAGKHAVLFVAARKDPHPNTIAAQSAGAEIVPVHCGYLSNVQAKARDYAAAHGFSLLPFGLDATAFIGALADVARAIPLNPSEVWVAAGSGVLARALQSAWPAAEVHAVQVGKPPLVGAAVLHRASERFDAPAKVTPPYPSSPNYDAKVWQFADAYGTNGALIWNVA